ncbi:hypothetical protein O181_031640 [Austropuccinia psidii MF-1]|uniref:Retroviral polymerase SH3-like domain-containing protein n=1 Tax=Austropuccinia psidii MF-1 TaxID=1389203 RepID=A0A9Q3CYA6_9BASI|nr:hypothetical protein [Austropuccinia psidii MF-1]
MDVVGPIDPPSVSGKRYFLTIVEQSSSYKIVKFLQKKSKVFEQFQATKIEMENTQNKKLKKLLSDRGGEFLNNEFKKLSNKSVLLSNLSPTASRKNHSPHFLWTNTPTRLTRLRKFSCRAVVYSLSRQVRWKLDPPGQPGIFIGYNNNNTEYQILRLNDLKVSITHYATLNKKVFPSISQKNTTKTFTTPLDEPFTPNNNQAINAPQDMMDAEQSLELADAIKQEETLETAQEVTDPIATQTQVPRIKIIGPRHPTLITAELNDLNILPYKRRPSALLSESNKTPQTYCGALKSGSHLLWQEAINKELENMHLLKVWDVVDLH